MKRSLIRMKNEFVKRQPGAIDPSIRSIPHVAEAFKQW